MLRSLVLGTVLLALLSTTVQAVTWTRGAKGRKYLRRFSLSENLHGDKKVVYETYGYTPHRLRTRWSTGVTERWIYYPLRLEFVFDADHNLIEKRTIGPDQGSYRAGHIEGGNGGW